MNYTAVLLFDDEINSKILYKDFGKVINQKLNGIKNERYKLQSAASYALLDMVICKLYGLKLNETDIIFNEYGKPLVANDLFHFNNSHSNNAVACSVSDKPIGVDIEYVSRPKKNIINKYFTENECLQINSDMDFYKFWTLKEAYLKYLGTGINRSMSEIEFILKDDIICYDNGKKNDNKFGIFDINGYVVAVCTPYEAKIPEVLNKKIFERYHI